MRDAILFALLAVACSDSQSTDGGLDGDVDVYLPKKDSGSPCGDTTQELPEKLSCTGLWSDKEKKLLAKNVVSYTPGISFWSDGLQKQRFIYLPPGEKIDTSNMDEWAFPVGTKVWKEFISNGTSIETRVYWKKGPLEWKWATYVWEPNDVDATRNDAGIPNAVGTYEVPPISECDKCHGGRKDKLLGIEAISLALPDAQGVTLASLVSAGTLSAPPAKTTATIPEDTTGKAAAALSYLHMNCGTTCHNRNSFAGAYFSALFLRMPATEILAGTATVAALDSVTTSVNIDITATNYSSYVSQGYKRIVPHDSSKSLVIAVTNLRGTGQMPPIVSHAVDGSGVAQLTAWVDAMP